MPKLRAAASDSEKATLHLGVIVERCHNFLVRLDPATSAQTAKTRPCVVVSPDELMPLPKEDR